MGVALRAPALRTRSERGTAGHVPVYELGERGGRPHSGSGPGMAHPNGEADVDVLPCLALAGIVAVIRFAERPALEVDVDLGGAVVDADDLAGIGNRAAVAEEQELETWRWQAVWGRGRGARGGGGAARAWEATEVMSAEMLNFMAASGPSGPVMLMGRKGEVRNVVCAKFSKPCLSDGGPLLALVPSERISHTESSSTVMALAEFMPLAEPAGNKVTCGRRRPSSEQYPRMNGSGRREGGADLPGLALDVGTHGLGASAAWLEAAGPPCAPRGSGCFACS